MRIWQTSLSLPSWAQQTIYLRSNCVLRPWAYWALFLKKEKQKWNASQPTSPRDKWWWWQYHNEESDPQPPANAVWQGKSQLHKQCFLLCRWDQRATKAAFCSPYHLRPVDLEQEEGCICKANLTGAFHCQWELLPPGWTYHSTQLKPFTTDRGEQWLTEMPRATLVQWGWYQTLNDTD